MSKPRRPVRACTDFASPKSSSFAPRPRQHDVARLQVAMDDPRAVRLVERVRDLNRERQGLVERHRAFPSQPVRERLAFEILHHQEVDAILVADVVQRADVRMIQRGDRRASRSNRSRNCGSVRARAADTLMATVRSRRVSRAR